ncbi:ATP phosphoribosyltransferase [Truepera radiovictrix DSM 17093]|uniref:ATP phosphoribosyltransferase n=2 Tax=Truepera TaxID=332248 RepID=D7CV13_TRURR|nr:ATP phosphoribosyltransferase [Truepera radiovictrix DSM 17093]
MAEMTAQKLTLALPKGRVMQESVARLRAAGLELELPAAGRALRYDAGDAVIIEMRNTDVPTYVDLGVADAGVVGKDVLLEANRDVYEPVDLGFARCRLSLIRPRGASGPVRRIASKYPRVARRYVQSRSLSAEVVKLAGNVELACLTGLADAVVDIVETGSTLRANHLEELDVLLYSSARFVVNRAALKLKGELLRPLIAALRGAGEP